jgi:hypothetical protein
MPGEVKSAAEATEIADLFLQKYYSYRKPIKTVKEGDVWVVDIDVGALGVRIAEVKVDAKTATVLEYSVPT